MKYISTIILIMGLLLASCGQHPVSGYVVGKKHEPERVELRYNVTLHMNTVHHIPERWIVYVADSTGVTPCNVTSETYLRLKKGQFVTAKGF